MTVQETIREFLELQAREAYLDEIAEAVWQRAKAKDSMPTVAPTAKAFDQMWARSTPLHLCSDHVFRNPAQLAAWIADGHDSGSRLRRELKAQHCGGQCSTHKDHLCSCGH